MTKFSRETITIWLKKELINKFNLGISQNSNGPFHKVMTKVGVTEGGGDKSPLFIAFTGVINAWQHNLFYSGNNSKK